ncbi:hypothetical protein PFISCL1PPCAC_5496, partial [Pristionchus fissidentatus]
KDCLDSKDEKKARELRAKREEMQRAHEVEMRKMEEQLRELTQRNEQTMKAISTETRRGMDQMKSEDEKRTEEMRRKIESDRREFERRRREEAAKESNEREKRETSRRTEINEDRKKGEMERNEYERMKKTEADVWNEKMRISEAEFNATKEQQEKELSRIRDEHENKLRKMMEDADRERELHADRLRRERERVAIAYQEYCSKWKNQMREMFTLMQQRIWSRQVEERWAARLAALREVHIPIHQSFFNLRFDLEDLTRCNGPDLSAWKRSEIEVKVSLLLDQLDVEIRIMGNEVDEMKKMAFEHPEAKFLADIQESADSIGKAANSLIESMEAIEKHLKTEYDQLLSVNQWKICENSFDDLERKIDLLPTLSGLKMKYQQ